MDVWLQTERTAKSDSFRLRLARSPQQATAMSQNNAREAMQGAKRDYPEYSWEMESGFSSGEFILHGQNKDKRLLIVDALIEHCSRRSLQVSEFRANDRQTGSYCSSIEELITGGWPTTQPEQRLSKHSAVRCEYWQQPPAALAMAKAAAMTLSGISSIPTHVVVTERQPKTESAAYCLS
jgi:hypothetical protein